MTVKKNKQEKIFILFQKGLSISAIAYELNLSEPTVRKYLKRRGYIQFSNRQCAMNRYFLPYNEQTFQLNSVMHSSSKYLNGIQSEWLLEENQRFKRENEDLKRKNDNCEEKIRKKDKENLHLTQKLNEIMQNTEKICHVNKKIMREAEIQKELQQEHINYYRSELQMNKKLYEKLMQSIECYKKENYLLRQQYNQLEKEYSNLKNTHEDLKSKNNNTKHTPTKNFTQQSENNHQRQEELLINPLSEEETNFYVP